LLKDLYNISLLFRYGRKATLEADELAFIGTRAITRWFQCNLKLNESALPQDLGRMLTNRSRIIEQHIERFSLPTAEDRDALWFNLALPDGHTKDGVCLPNPLPDILTLSERYNEWIAKSPA
jgi:hypothetical protein